MLTLKFPSNRASEGVQFIDIRAQLPVNPHYTWAQLAGIRPPEALNTIVCHHDGIPKYKTVQYSDITLAQRIAIDHINSKKNHPNGDAGFPYDVWIRNGIIYWCNDIEAREYGVAGNNGYTVNICVSGEYAYTDVLTEADRKSLYVAILMMKEALPADKYIKGHKELSPTACPGYDMDKVREDVTTLENQIMFEESDQNKKKIAFGIMNQMTFFYNLSLGKNPDGTPTTEGKKVWGMDMIMSLEPEFRKRGFLK